MSKKFTGITSAGSAIPVYDKDAHSALEQKLDTSAFSSVSGEFATVDDVVAAVSGKADTSAIPSLDGYATEEWVGEQGYLTEVPESAVSGFATHEEVDEATSGKMNVSGLASGSKNLPFYPYITSVYSAYNGVPFYAAYTSGDKLDTSAATAVSPNFSRNSDQNFGYAKFSGWLENVGIDISGAHKNKRIYITDEGITLSGYSSQSDAGRNINGHYLNITPENYVDKTKFKNIVASDNEIFVPNDIKTVSGNYDTVYHNYSFIGDFSGNDNLGKEFTVTLPAATTSFSYTAAEQDWNWLYKGTLTSEEPKTVWKVTPDKDYNEINSEVSTATFYTFQITQSPFPVTGGVVSASIVTWNDEVFATRPWVEEQLSANVPQGVMQTSGLEYDGDKISGYMGSAFAGGGEVPEDVMAESGLEFNAVNEISGYNGSAIAQYGAEKQWLVHDDTLVHAANSAQYALGVNLSAVAQLLGVDETVLWETNGSDFIASGSRVNFSSNPYDYDKIKFVASSDEMAPVEITTYPSSARINVSWEQITNNQFRIWDTIVNIDSAGMTAGPAVMAMANSTGTGNSISTNQINWTWNYRLIKKVIGIGRKQ